MAELINKWDVVNKLIRLENEYQFFKGSADAWDAEKWYRRICELEIGIGKTPAVATDNNVGHKWIPVTESLPEKEGLYIVHGNLGGVFVLFYDDMLSDSFEQMCTHWMPMPEPPKGE